MKIEFYAPQVRCAQAMDWEIVQVQFDSVSPGELDDLQSDRSSPCVMIGVNFEFSGSPRADWHDGDNWGGEVGIRKIRLKRTIILVDLKSDLNFAISLKLSDERYDELKKHLRILFRGSRNELAVEEGDGTTSRRVQ